MQGIFGSQIKGKRNWKSLGTDKKASVASTHRSALQSHARRQLGGGGEEGAVAGKVRLIMGYVPRSSLPFLKEESEGVECGSQERKR